MARNKRTTRRTTVQNQQQLQVELHNNSVLALAAPPLPPSPPPLTPSPKVVAGGSSPDKFVFFAEEGAVQQPIVPSPSTPDHIIVEDCSDQEDFEDEEVDYSASGEYPSSFHSPLPTSTGKIVDINPNSASRVSPISESGHSVTPEPSPSNRRSSPVPPLQQFSPGCDGVAHNLPKVAPHTDGPQAPAPVEKWRDLFATNRSTITGPKLPPTTTNKDRSVFNRLGPVDGQIGVATSQGKANGQIGESSHSYDPMATEVASGEWEIVRSKKARNSPSISKPNNAMGNKGSSQSSQQPLDPLQAEVEAVSGGWEVVKGKKSNSSHKETPITATHQRITSKDKEVAGPTDVRVRGDESITHQNISNEGTTGSNVVLLRTQKQSREDISVGCNVRTGETVGNEITQKAAPPASPGVRKRLTLNKRTLACISYEESQLAKITRDSAKITVEQVHGLMSQVIKDILFNSVRQSNRSRAETSGPEPMLQRHMASRGEKEHKKITSTAHLLFIAYETVLCSAATLTPPENGEIKCGKGHPSVMDFQEELKKWTCKEDPIFIGSVHSLPPSPSPSTREGNGR
ncbi:hypothetical protein NC653_040439 [Populus alba x Populus x berolinensis]|uniref:Cop9 signalosome subunit 5 C-terminal domain-containing protein n=1 Tax=Populus alba x Populus x berolinensis TaxID=444605 RepID=A0AAD6LDS1_9ROSI|nr:hypothetical protein NC653_040439 [Populus alba x Populus x berolinensis]